MDEGLLLFQKSKPENSLIEDIFSYDVRTLEQTDDMFISKGVIALSQYLVYFKSQYNITRAEITRKERILEGVLFGLITPAIIKEFKTKKDARASLVYTNQVLNTLQDEIDALKKQMQLYNNTK